MCVYMEFGDVPAISETASRGPVELEGAVGVGDQLAVEREGLGSGVSAGEVDEAVSGIAAVR